MKFSGLFLMAAAAALATVYVLSSFPVPAFAEQAIFTSQAAADQVDAGFATNVLQAVVSLMALVVIVCAIAAALHGPFRRRADAGFDGGFTDAWHGRPQDPFAERHPPG